MGVSAYSRLFLGFEVQQSDFIETVISEVATCSEGHPQTGPDSFCSKDGGKFERKRCEQATKALYALVEFSKFEFDVSKLKKPNYISNYVRDLYDEGPLFEFEGREKIHYNNRPALKSADVCGVYLSSLSANHDPVAVLDDNAMQEARKKVEAMRNALGMQDRPVKLYHAIRMS